MAKPWKKQWPRVGKRGKKSYVIGFYDHDRVERTRHFSAARMAADWITEYCNAERRGRESLRRFLLDLDAAEASESEGRPPAEVADGRALGEVVELFFALDADPQLEGGLAPATFNRYRNAANCHILGNTMHNHKGEPIGRASYAVALASLPAIMFNEPAAPRKWREEMRHARVSAPTRHSAWQVLSAVLSWAARSDSVPEIQTNGCILANERAIGRRRSARRAGTGATARGRRHGAQNPSWALSPQAVEAIRAQMLKRSKGRDPVLAERDAVIVSLQYGTGGRNQEVWGMRWMCVGDSFADIVEVTSSGALDEWGKTENSTQRRTEIPSLLHEDLLHWREVLRACGHPARDIDFVIPGDLGGSKWGVRDPRTGAVHLSANQASKWGAKFFGPAVKLVAQTPQFADIRAATQYSLRRGSISVRLRAEDPQTVADECGTSLQMLDQHYAFAIRDLRRFGPRPFDVEWRAARDERPAG